MVGIMHECIAYAQTYMHTQRCACTHVFTLMHVYMQSMYHASTVEVEKGSTPVKRVGLTPHSGVLNPGDLRVLLSDP